MIDICIPELEKQDSRPMDAVTPGEINRHQTDKETLSHLAAFHD